MANGRKAVTLRQLARNGKPYIIAASEGERIEVLLEDQAVAILGPMDTDTDTDTGGEAKSSGVSLGSESQLDRLRWMLEQSQAAIARAGDVRTKMGAIKEARQISKELAKATGEHASPGSRIVVWERMTPAEIILELQKLIEEVRAAT
jgi:hypothetical protein